MGSSPSASPFARARALTRVARLLSRAPIRPFGRGLRAMFGAAVALPATAGVLVCALAGASPAAAEEVCPNAATRGGPSAELPDCRAYEQVSPEFKNGGIPYVLSLAPDGESLMLTGDLTSLLPSTADSIGQTHYFARRTAQGWALTATDASASEYFAVIPEGAESLPEAATQVGSSLNGEASLWEYTLAGMPKGEYNLYLQSAPGGRLVEVGPLARPGGKLAVADTSNDLGDVLLSGSWPLPTAGSGVETVESLFEYTGVGNVAPLPVGVGENGQLISKCGTALGSPNSKSLQNAVSADGSSVVFTALACGAALPVSEMFVRVDNGEPDAHTVAISEPSATDCAACDTEAKVRKSAEFLGASEDGSKVFFETEQPLLAGVGGKNIYEYDFDAPAGDRVTLVSGGDGESEPRVQGVAQVSEDGARVYFIANGVLTSAPNGQGQLAEQGASNIYAYDTKTKQLTFVVAASAGYFQTTPDGRFLIFQSGADLTPDDTSSVNQVFEYDALTGALARVSVGQDGYNNDGNTSVYGAITAPAVRVTYAKSPDEYASNLSVTETGAVFFESGDALTSQAVQGENEVYEYEHGQVYLIAGGVASHPYLIGTDESGGDVFFSTALGLVQSDLNNSTDIYDARVDGGYSFYVPPECSGEECQGQLSGTPVLLAPGSEFQAGGGNLPSPPAARSSKAKAKKGKARTKKKKKKAAGGKGGRRAKRSSTASRARSGKGRK